MHFQTILIPPLWQMHFSTFSKIKLNASESSSHQRLNPILSPTRFHLHLLCKTSIQPRSRKLENLCLLHQIRNANSTSYQQISWKNASKNSARSSPHWSIIHWQKDVFPQFSKTLMCALCWKSHPSLRKIWITTARSQIWTSYPKFLKR